MIGRIGMRLVEIFALPVVLTALWWVLSADSTNFFFPPLSSIVDVFVPTWFEGRILDDVVPSLLRLAAGYLLALLVGILLGSAIGSSTRLRQFCEPVLEFLRAIPPPVLVPILMLFAGVDNTMKVLVIFSGCIWPILLNTVEGVRGVDPVLRDTARSYRMPWRTTYVHLVLRGASPRIAAGARQALAIGIILMVISEMFAATNGIGFTTIQFQRSFAIPEMWSGIILLGFIGLGLSLLFRFAESRVLRWYEGMRRQEREG
ncbi:ABC-type nitrate/sulfonate/bicarbonate transport system permease component [Mumia flava]|uniref:ABC-type nitrate/sulfonate/bicarbonate transport system permease component n=1 Tax=Mumia flava TaxID=1348852 RepID=A0A0B2BBT2_9ACTN|nr:ABC transporter permease [Mumia flava]PJJ57528.1 ABC-type nitrate/sulfonate/bicarbonate transport system permease component [Mumia flava]